MGERGRRLRTCRLWRARSRRIRRRGEQVAARLGMQVAFTCVGERSYAVYGELLRGAPTCRKIVFFHDMQASWPRAQAQRSWDGWTAEDFEQELKAWAVEA